LPRVFPQPVKPALILWPNVGVKTPASLRTGFLRSLYSPGDLHQNWGI
jgi:hypothetical protein